MLGILSMLNWGMATLYVSVIGLFLVFAGPHMPFSAIALIVVIGSLLVAPSAYLGYVIEKGRGRTLQTVIAFLSLLEFPLGTAYGAFALWVCWSLEKDLFDRGGHSEDEEKPAPRRARPPRVEDVEDEVTAPRARNRTPYQLVQQLKKQGLKSGEVQEQLHVEGLSADEIETLMTSVGLKFSRVKQKHLEEFS